MGSNDGLKMVSNAPADLFAQEAGCQRCEPIFNFLRKLGTTRAEMLKVFNMGIGFVFVVKPAFANGVMRVLQRVGEHPIRLGRVQRGGGRVKIR